MSPEEIEREIKSARRENGTYPAEWVKKMNDKGVWFAFMQDGVRWSKHPFK